jgi:transcriptional regulator with XRE-family HTH domain
MEANVLTASELRERMRARRVTQNELAERAGINQPHLSAILRGREYCSPARHARIGQAIKELGLHKVEPQPEPVLDEPATPPAWRISRL